MSEAYSVVFSGDFAPGFERDQVLANLAKVFKIGEAEAERLISKADGVLKRNLDEARAGQFRDVLERIGLVVHVTAEAPAEPENAAPAEAPAAAVPTTDEPADLSPRPFAFEGKGGEYFKIWIVNVVLSVLTLGIYSAWAKVRTNRYFYGNTRVADGSFEYLAKPLPILKGRIIGALLLVTYMVLGNLAPPLQLVGFVLLIVVLPWLVSRSLAFRNRNTALRNIRFGFDGGYGGAFKSFILWPIAAALTFGLLGPYALYKQDEYIVSNSRYGTTPFEFGARVKEYYMMALGMIGIFLVGMLIFMGAGAMMGAGVGFEMAQAGAETGAMEPTPALVGAMFLPALVLMGFYLLAFAYFAARRGNLVYGQSTLGDHRFDSTLKTVKLGWIYLSNWLLLVVTLGLARPWTKVRLARYRAEQLVLLPGSSLDAFLAAEEQHVSALGEEIGEAFDLDIAL